MYKADGKCVDQMSAEELAALPNFYDNQKPEKFLRLQKSQKELEELVNNKGITLERFMKEICPFGFFWTMVDDTMIDYSIAWEPGYTDFTPYCYRQYGALLKSIVSIHPQGLLCIDYKNPQRAEDFIAALRGLASKSTISALFGNA